MRRLLALLAPLALVACASAPRVATGARAAPPAPAAAPAPENPESVAVLPDGWSAAGPPKVGRTAALRSEAEPVDVGALPIIEISRRPEGGAGLAAIEPKAEGPKATEVRTLGGRVTIAGHRFGGVSVGVGEMPFFDFTEGGTLLMNTRGVTQLAWTSFDAADDGALDVELVRGFYDASRKQGVESEHLRIHAAPLAGGTYFGFRTSCTACAPGERERLHLVGPGAIGNIDGGARREPTAGALVAYVSLPLDPGTSGGTATFLRQYDAVEWGRRTGVDVKKVSRLPVGFYASRGPDDAAPLVVMRTTRP